MNYPLFPLSYFPPYFAKSKRDKGKIMKHIRSFKGPTTLANLAHLKKMFCAIPCFVPYQKDRNYNECYCYSIGGGSQHDDNLKSLYVQMYKREANTGSHSTCYTCSTLTSTVGLFQEKFHSEHRSHFQSRMCPCYARCYVQASTQNPKRKMASRQHRERDRVGSRARIIII